MWPEHAAPTGPANGITRRGNSLAGEAMKKPSAINIAATGSKKPKYLVPVDLWEPPFIKGIRIIGFDRAGNHLRGFKLEKKPTIPGHTDLGEAYKRAIKEPGARTVQIFLTAADMEMHISDWGHGAVHLLDSPLIRLPLRITDLVQMSWTSYFSYRHDWEDFVSGRGPAELRKRWATPEGIKVKRGSK